MAKRKTDAYALGTVWFKIKNGAYTQMEGFGDGMATLLQPSAWSAGNDNVVVKPLTGLKVTGHLSHVVIGPAEAN